MKYERTEAQDVMILLGFTHYELQKLLECIESNDSVASYIRSDFKRGIQTAMQEAPKMMESEASYMKTYNQSQNVSDCS